MGIQIGCYVIGMIQTNCYYVWREGSDACIVFDPADMGLKLYEALEEKELSVQAIFLTHGHYDHIYGVEALRKASGARVYAPMAEEDVCLDPQLNCSRDFGRVCTVSADKWLADGETVTEAGITLRMLLTPGHTEGSSCYYIEEAGALISGDTLFEESVGRTDLPTGSMRDLVDSVKQKLYVLPDETGVYPGHGGFTTIGHEKTYNYFVH